MKKYVINYYAKGLRGEEIIITEGDEDDAISQLWGKLRALGVQLPPLRCAEIIDIQANRQGIR